MADLRDDGKQPSAKGVVAKCAVRWVKQQNKKTISDASMKFIEGDLETV